MIIYLYIFHENSLLTLEIICLISTLYIIIYLTSLHCFYYVVFNVGYRQYQSHAIINYLSINVSSSSSSGSSFDSHSVSQISSSDSQIPASTCLEPRTLDNIRTPIF